MTRYIQYMGVVVDKTTPVSEVEAMRRALRWSRAVRLLHRRQRQQMPWTGPGPLLTERVDYFRTHVVRDPDPVLMWLAEPVLIWAEGTDDLGLPAVTAHLPDNVGLHLGSDIDYTFSFTAQRGSKPTFHATAQDNDYDRFEDALASTAHPVRNRQEARKKGPVWAREVVLAAWQAAVRGARRRLAEAQEAVEEAKRLQAYGDPDAGRQRELAGAAAARWTGHLHRIAADLVAAGAPIVLDDTLVRAAFRWVNDVD